MPIFPIDSVLVIGGGGALARAFSSESPAGTVLHGMDLPAAVRPPGYSTWIPGNAGDSDTVARALKSTEARIVVSFAGAFGSANFQAMVSANVGIARSVLECARCLPAEARPRVLLIGSAAEYGVPLRNPVSEDHPAAPVNDYGLTKLYQTELALSYYRRDAVAAIVARVFNVDGPGLSMDLAAGRWRRLIQDLPDGATLEVGNLESMRDYLPIEGAAKDLWTIASRGAAGEIYNVCSGRPIRMSSLLDSLIEESGKRIHPSRSLALCRGNDVPIIYGDRSKLEALSR